MTDQSVIIWTDMSPRREDPDRDKKRTAIVMAAARVFSRSGYRAATMEEVSQEAGIAKGTTYLYFRSKRELFLAVFNWFVLSVAQKAEEAMGPRGSGAAVRLGVFVETSLVQTVAYRDMFPLFCEGWAAITTGSSKERITQAVDRMYDRFTEAIEKVIRSGIERGEFRPGLDAKALAVCFIAVLDGLSLQAWIHPEADHQAWARKFTDTLIRGMVP
jgi:AcrR family transcriptional regulator